MNEFLKIVVSFVLGFLSAVFAEPLRRWLFSPTILVAFRPRFGAGSRYISITPDNTETEKRMAKYVRASGKNTSRVTAKGCKVFLTAIEKETEQDHFRTLHHDPLPLPWAFIGTSAIDIPPGIEFYFDIIAVLDSDNKMIPQTTPKPYAWDQLLKDIGRYRFTVLLAGENIRPVPLSLTFTWGGSFDSLTEDSFT